MYNLWNSIWVSTVLEEDNPSCISCLCEVKGLVFCPTQASSLSLLVPCRALRSRTYFAPLQMLQYVSANQMSPIYYLQKILKERQFSTCSPQYKAYGASKLLPFLFLFSRTEMYSLHIDITVNTCSLTMCLYLVSKYSMKWFQKTFQI